MKELLQKLNENKTRSFDSISEQECRDIVNICFGDYEAFDGPAVNEIKIITKTINHAAGTLSMGGGDTYEFTIGNNGFVGVYKTNFDEEKTEYVTEWKRNRCNPCNMIAVYLLNAGFLIR